MKYYKTKAKLIPGSSYKLVVKVARAIFHDLKKKTKRKPYIRSAYFNKEKIFFDFFWTHLNQKSVIERMERLKYFSCAIELVQKTKITPLSKPNPNNKKELLYRFLGTAKDGENFVVQIKLNKKTNDKYLMSVFNLKKPPPKWSV